MTNPMSAARDLHLPDGVTAHQLLAKLRQEQAEADEAARRIAEEKAEAAAAERRAKNEAGLAEYDRLIGEYKRLRKELLPVLRDLWRLEREHHGVVRMHPHLWKANLPSLAPKDPNNVNFSSMDVIHCSKGNLEALF